MMAETTGLWKTAIPASPAVPGTSIRSRLIPAIRMWCMCRTSGGDNWTLENSDPRLTSRPWYFNSVTIDPSNPDVVYVPNIGRRQLDSGKQRSPPHQPSLVLQFGHD